MTRLASAPLMSLADAAALLTRDLRPVAARTRALADALGAVVAEDVVAVRDRPPCPVAFRDGWAVAQHAVAGASPYGPVPLPAAPAWVEAGDRLPDGTDTVLAPDALDPADPRSIVADAPLGDGARPAAADLRAGQTLVTAGRVLTVARILALAAAGIASLPVRRPTVGLVMAGRAPDGLSAALEALIQRAGGRVVAVARPGRETAVIANAIEGTEGDAVLTVGGTGFGRTDRTADALARIGTVRAHGIALEPGGTAGFGLAQGRPVLMLPGRPEAALAAALALGDPLLGGLAGGMPATGIAAVLRRKITSTVGLATIAFVRRVEGGIEPLGRDGIALAALAEADGAVLVPPEREGYASGETVEMLTL